ncbi:Retrovirus-related Pol polyprotein from transposon TNT 1-94 [Dendrobium catenatum]|uniref:Retrovirus-related Pol polyprotein from transposon TNT 1-94 n=1 Tax=Dendrobium catenatum TaxID=906689 RepID=A0A2I0WGQ2_9ASPA|nr:Retrovirus-related Pol polyprotein from transposon TNT 1-94 [Dendrobium catenatum]
MITRQFNAKLKIFRSDGGGEFINNKFYNLFKQHGIIHQYTCAHTPPQNGVAERKHKHILEIVRSLLIEANIPRSLWVEALFTAVYLINRTPSRSTQNLSPYHMLYQKPASYAHLKIFGCLCYPWLKPYNPSKLSSLSTPCVFIGYATTQKGYRCLDPKSGRVYVSRHVVFNEASFPYQSTTPQQTTISVAAPTSIESFPDSQTGSTPAITPPPRHHMITRSKTGTFKPKTILNLIHTDSNSVTDPTSYSEAARSEHWRRAMSAEFQALQSQGTWDLVPPSPDQNVLGCKWTFRTKYLSDGTIARHKTCLVAKGFDQEHGLDYNETFSPVAKMPTIRILLVLALHQGWKIHQLDVSNAFLHGNLHHTIHMKQPHGFTDAIHPTYVCRLNKALYGLKQLPREWFATLSGHLITYGFKLSTSDTSLFIYNKNKITMYFLVYVDDIILTGSCQAAINNLIAHLNSRFPVKDLGTISHFLGIQVVHTTYGLHLNQSRFAQTILSRAGMLNCKPVSTPFQLKSANNPSSSNAFSNPTLYRHLAGSLQFLTITRPDISFAVNRICQHMQNPTVAHFEALKRLLRYLQGTIHTGLPLFRGTLTLQSYADSDWAGDEVDRKSTTGYCNFLGSSLISWAVKKQNVVARSSTEAEYRALATASAEIIWIRRLLQELNTKQNDATTLFCDNTSAIALANNPVLHARTKHIEVTATTFAAASRITIYKFITYPLKISSQICLQKLFQHPDFNGSRTSSFLPPKQQLEGGCEVIPYIKSV